MYPLQLNFRYSHLVAGFCKVLACFTKSDISLFSDSTKFLSSTKELLNFQYDRPLEFSRKEYNIIFIAEWSDPTEGMIATKCTFS